MILITGGSGLIGKALIERLLEDGHNLRVQVRDRQRLNLPASASGKVEVMEADFTQIAEPAFKRLAEGCRTVIHTAALVHQPEAQFQAYELLNVRTTSQLAAYAQSAGVDTFVFFSTIAVYGDGPYQNAGEKDPLKPVTPYAVSKANSEQDLCRMTGFKRLVILRPAMVFGEGDRGNLIKLIRQLKTGRFFFLGNKPVRKSLIYSRDVANAVAACLSSLSEGQHTFNVANPQAVDLPELVSLISSGLGRKGQYPAIPEGLARLLIKGAQGILGSASPVRWEQIEKLNTTATVSVNELVKATGFVPRWALSDATKREIDWAAADGLI